MIYREACDQLKVLTRRRGRNAAFGKLLNHLIEKKVIAPKWEKILF